MYPNGLINRILIMRGHNNFPLLKPTNHQPKTLQIIVGGGLEVGHDGILDV